MTPERKAQLTAIIDEVKAVKTKLDMGLLTDAENIRDAQDSDSEAYVQMNDICYSFDNASDDLERAIQNLKEVLEDDAEVLTSGDEDGDEDDEDDSEYDEDYDDEDYDDDDACDTCLTVGGLVQTPVAYKARCQPPSYIQIRSKQ